MPVNHQPRLAILLIFCCTVPAWAQDRDTLQFNAGYELQTDTNVFRLPASKLASGGTPSETEHIRRSSLGLSVDKPYSLQRFQLDLGLIDSRYQNSSYLSFIARNASAAWLWSVTPKLHGNISGSRTETLSSFADNQTVNVRNLQRNTSTRIDATYELTGPWSVVGGVTSKVQSYVQPLAAEGATSSIAGDAGFSYSWPSGTQLSYAFKDTKGSYTNRVIQPTLLYDDGFNQRDNELKLHWIVSDKSTIDMSSAYISRTHPHFAERNYSGFNSGLGLNWAITGRTAVTTAWIRELSSYQDTVTNYTRTDRLSLSPSWQISAKTTVKASYSIAVRDYMGSPSGLTASPRRDTTRETSLSLEWLPSQNLTLSTSLQNAKRSSNQSAFDYKSNMAMFKAQYSY